MNFLPSCRILLGDAFATLQGFPDGVFQSCITSPPYWGLRDYGVEGQVGGEETPEEYVARLGTVFAQVYRVLRDDGTLWLNLGDSYTSGNRATRDTDNKLPARINGYRPPTPEVLKSKNLIGIPWRVAFALQAAGWYLRQDIIRAKPNLMPAPVTDRCVSAHEYLFLLAKSPRYFFDHLAIQEEATGRASGNGFRRDHRISIGGRGDETKYEGAAKRNKRDVWTVTPSPFKGAHFATMPEGLVSPCVLASSRPGDLILDPFFGSGTTGLVAAQLDRAFVGIELNSEYVQIALNRLGWAK